MHKRIVAIGHIVNDTEPSDHLGGPVSYTSVTAVRLGFDVAIITKCPPNHPYVTQLQNYGITVHVLPSKHKTIETNVNIYDEIGHKHFKKAARQEPITLADIKRLPNEIFTDAAIMGVSDSGELELDTFPYLSSLGYFGALVQGYFREIDAEQHINHKKWYGDEQNLKGTNVVILSDEDATINGAFYPDIIKSLKKQVDVTVTTQGHDGSTIYTKTGEEIKITAFPLQRSETNDFNGAGDVYTAAFFTKFTETKDLRLAGTFASLLAGVKLIGIGGIGMDSIPTKAQLNTFVKKNKARVAAFYAENSVPFPTSF